MTTESKKSKFITPPFVLSYPNLFKPRMNELSDRMEYGCAAIWEPAKFTENDKKKFQAINNAICEAIAKHAWPKGVKIPMSTAKTANARRLEMEEALRKKFPKANMGIRDGSEKDDKPGYGDGKLFASLKTANVGGTPRQPGIINRNGDTISIAEGNADEIYPGCICQASVNVFCYPDPTKQDMGGRGYSLSLNNVRKIKDGTRLDNFTSAEDDFADEEVDEAWLEGEEGEDKFDEDDVPF